MRELPFYYNHKLQKFEYSNPEYCFDIKDKQDEFIDVYLKDFVFDENKRSIYGKNKFITSFSKNFILFWDQILNPLRTVFLRIQSELNNSDVEKRVHINFYTNRHETYYVLSYDRFVKLLNSIGVEKSFISIILNFSQCPWMYQFFKSLCSDYELCNFVNCTFCNEVQLRDFIIDNTTNLVWIEKPSVDFWEDSTNIYKYFKANKCEEIKSKKYDEIFKFDTSISPNNCLETQNGDASVLAFLGLNRPRVNNTIDKCDILYSYSESNCDKYAVHWNSIIEKYLKFMNIKFNKDIDKIYYTPIKSTDKNIKYVAFKYKRKK